MNNIISFFSIKDLENISGVKAHTIRIWEKRYGLLKPQRTHTNIRYYTNESLQKLLNIVLLNKHNYKISKIAEMGSEGIILKSRELAHQTAKIDSAINAFKLAMFQFDKVLFNNTYNKLLQTKTFRELFKEVFIPFLNHIGLLWQTNTLVPAHEHFISNLIIQKIQSNTEKLAYTINNSEYTYVLFLPLNEIHEIGLLYLNYELNLRGLNTIYLGQNLPLEDLKHFLDTHKKMCFVLSSTIQPYKNKMEDYFEKIDNLLKDTNHKFIAVGKKTIEIKNRVFCSDITFYSSITDLLIEL